MHIKNKLIIIISFMFLVAFSSAYAADKEKNDGLARVAFIKAKPGEAKDLEKSIIKHHRYMADKKGAFRYDWYKVETGPDSGSYIARSGSHNWADFDVDRNWDKIADKSSNKHVSPYIDSVRSSITKTDQELGIWPDDLSDYNYFLLTRWHIKSGKNKAFNDGLKKVDAMLKKNQWPNYYAFVETISGGRGNTLLLVSPRKNFADMAPKEPKFIDIINKTMGEKEAQAFLKDWGQTYKTGDYFMIKYLPKQSDYGD